MLGSKENAERGVAEPLQGPGRGLPLAVHRGIAQGFPQPFRLTHLGPALMKFPKGRSEAGEIFQALDAFRSFKTG